MDLGELGHHGIVIEDLLARGPGLLVEAEGEEERVLIWLE